MARRNENEVLSEFLDLSFLVEVDVLRKVEISLSVSGLLLEGIDSSKQMFQNFSTWMAVLWSVLNSNSIWGPELLILGEGKEGEEKIVSGFSEHCNYDYTIMSYSHQDTHMHACTHPHIITS